MAGGISASGPWMFSSDGITSAVAAKGACLINEGILETSFALKIILTVAAGIKTPPFPGVVSLDLPMPPPSSSFAFTQVSMPLRPSPFPSSPPWTKRFPLFHPFHWSRPVHFFPVRTVIPLSRWISAVKRKLSSHHWSCSRRIFRGKTAFVSRWGPFSRDTDGEVEGELEPGG